MKKFLAFLALLGLIAFLGIGTIKENIKKDLAEPVSAPSPEPSPENLKEVEGVKKSAATRSVFVPYWGLDESLEGESYDEFLYFGITPGNNGVDRQEEGYRSLKEFIDSVPDESRTRLVLRMLDSDVTFPILKDSAKQSSVIKDSISIAKAQKFDGIVLDLEISAVPFDSLVKQVNAFTATFYKEAQRSNVEFAIMFYGDTFHRLRPFDVKALSKNADEFYIMSYDFSKSRGNPGPNFPLKGKEVYGYDMTRMVDDFLRFLPHDKTTIVFGLFGYDWEVDDKGVAVSPGEPLTYKQIESKFLGKCEYEDCDVKRKNDSRETEIRYKDNEGKNHIVWFEDMESVEEKEKYLRENGIGSFSFWAYSYF
jgi:spore germination protein